MPLHKALLSVVSPAGAGGNLSILIFHRVTPQPDPLFPGEADAARFDAICSWLRQWYEVLPLGLAVQRLQQGSLPARALAITFDDGYADNHDVALPILQRHGLHATFFVASGFLDGGCMWNDRIIESLRQYRGHTLDLPSHLPLQQHRLTLGSWAQKRQAIDQLLPALKHQPLAQRVASAQAIVEASGATLPSTLMMSSAQVALMAQAGMAVGGHTVNHPILARLPEAEALDEMARGKQVLEAIIQAPVDLLAYPNGRPDEDYTARDAVLAARAGFKAAVSTAWGVSSAGADIYQLPRFTPWDQGRLRFGLRLALNVRNAVRVSRHQDLAAASDMPSVPLSPDAAPKQAAS